MKAANDIKMLDTQRLTTIESVKFIKKASINIMKAVTKEFHLLISQFIDFRTNTWQIIDDLKDYSDRMKKAELVAAMQFPIYDFRYRSDPDCPFRLYHCLTPVLKQHKKIPAGLVEQGYINDLDLRLRLRESKYNLRRDKINRLEAENKDMREEIGQLRNELSVVNLQIQFE